MSKVTLYHANWCGHCVKFQPEWKNIKAKLDQIGIEHAEFEQTADGAVMEKEGIKGFPTIKITKNGKTSEYEGQRNLNSILESLDVSAQSGGYNGCADRRDCRRGNSINYHQKYLKYKQKYLKLKKTF